jgi:hypothetical protein
MRRNCPQVALWEIAPVEFVIVFFCICFAKLILQIRSMLHIAALYVAISQLPESNRPQLLCVLAHNSRTTHLDESFLSLLANKIQLARPFSRIRRCVGIQMSPPANHVFHILFLIHNSFHMQNVFLNVMTGTNAMIAGLICHDQRNHIPRAGLLPISRSGKQSASNPQLALKSIFTRIPDNPWNSSKEQTPK